MHENAIVHVAEFHARTQVRQFAGKGDRSFVILLSLGGKQHTPFLRVLKCIAIMSLWKYDVQIVILCYHRAHCGSPSSHVLSGRRQRKLNQTAIEMSGDARRENDDVLGVESPLALNDILAPAHAATPNQPRSPTNKYEDQQDGGEVDKDDPLSNASQLEELARSLRTPGDANAPIIKSGNKKEGRITMTTQRRQTMPHTQQTEQNYAPVPQKSELTSLCERFLHHYCHLNADGSPSTLVLTDVATSLGVSRRRIYDIINVLEAIDVIKRTDKLTYQFCGYFHFPVLFESLAAAARETATSSVHSPLRPTKKAGTGKPSVYSLSALTRRLVSLLVVGGPSPIKVSEAAVELVAMGGGGSGVGGGESVDAGHNNPNNPNNNNSSTSDDTKSGGRSQTQITVERRLYDIGSILGSVGLVEKIYIGKRKPAFQWVYGWRPGDEHTPPELAVAKAAKEPAPPLPPPPPPQPQPQVLLKEVHFWRLRRTTIARFRRKAQAQAQAQFPATSSTTMISHVHTYTNAQSHARYGTHKPKHAHTHKKTS